MPRSDFLWNIPCGLADELKIAQGRVVRSAVKNELCPLQPRGVRKDVARVPDHVSQIEPPLP